MTPAHVASGAAVLPSKDSIFSDRAQLADVTNSVEQADQGDDATARGAAAQSVPTQPADSSEADAPLGDSNAQAEHLPVSSGLWPHEPWGVFVRTGRARNPDGSAAERQNEQWIELERPFALIGPHPDCDIRLEDDRLPDVVYFCARVDDSIQVWPLCALAFSQWGTITPSKTLFVGKTRIRFLGAEHDEFPSETEAATRPTAGSSEVARSAANRQNLIFDWGEGFVAKGIRRSVTLIGESHPSTLRLHGYGLQTCHLAVIEQGRGVWVIDLDLSGRNPDSPLVHRLGVAEKAIRVGMVDLWLNEQGTPWNQDPKLRLGRAPRRYHVPTPELTIEATSQAQVAPVIPNNEPAAPVVNTDKSEQPAASEQPIATPQQEVRSTASIAKPLSLYHETTPAEPLPASAIAIETAPKSWRNRPEKASVQAKGPPLDDEGDPLSDRTIDRMIQRDAKANRLRMASLIALAGLAVTVSVVIVFGWVIPTFRNIIGLNE